MRYVAWIVFAFSLLVAAYGAYQYLYFTGVVGAPLLPPALAATQPSYPVSYVDDVVGGLVGAGAMLGIILHGRQRAKSVRGFEVLGK